MSVCRLVMAPSILHPNGNPPGKKSEREKKKDVVVAVREETHELNIR